MLTIICLSSAQLSWTSWTVPSWYSHFRSFETIIPELASNVLCAIPLFSSFVIFTVEIMLLFLTAFAHNLLKSVRSYYSSNVNITPWSKKIFKFHSKINKMAYPHSEKNSKVTILMQLLQSQWWLNIINKFCTDAVERSGIAKLKLSL